MRTKLLIMGLALMPFCARADSWYVRPEVSYFEPRTKGADTTVGVFAAVGRAWGSAEANELELELGWASWEEQEESVDPWEPFVAQSDNQVVPILVNYRRQFSLSERVRGYVEGGLGMGLVSTEWTNTTPWGSARGSADEVGAAVSAGVGLRWRVSERTALLGGLRYLAALVPGESVLDDSTVDDVSVTAFTLEVGVRFAW